MESGNKQEESSRRRSGKKQKQKHQHKHKNKPEWLEVRQSQQIAAESKQFEIQQREQKWSRRREEVGEAHPDFYKRHAVRFGTHVNTELEDLYREFDALVPVALRAPLEEMVKELAAMDAELTDERKYAKAIAIVRRKHRLEFRKPQLLFIYKELIARGELKEGRNLIKYLVKHSVRSHSGVLVITVMTSPYPKIGDREQKFTCRWNCYYCPNEPGQPRSYLHDEPSVLRGNQNNFDPVLQFTHRALVLAQNGHPVDKIEVLVLGGTWSSYPHEYQENFIRDLFFAANTFSAFRPDKPPRQRRSLVQEKLENESARVKIIGLTLETRPDCITADEIRRFRFYGCTRVQLGVQHTDEAILDAINRDCTTAQTKQAIQLLKDNCYKIDVHLMPNLPFSSPEKDCEMFDTMVNDPDLQVDQWKIYPTEITPWTVIKEWFDRGEYAPYDQQTLMEVLIHVKQKVHPWVRLNRVIRDIPMQYVFGALEESNLRERVSVEMKNRGLVCHCIRCREVKTNKQQQVPELVVRKYESSGGQEIFISYETHDRSKIFGFVRLRLSRNAGLNVPGMTLTLDAKGGKFKQTGYSKNFASSKPTSFQRVLNSQWAEHSCGHEAEVIFPAIRGAALVRELHVYGKMIATEDKRSKHAQHTGLGSELMRAAEDVARAEGYKKIAVIAGVGVRNFYTRLGYRLDPDSELLVKTVSSAWYAAMARRLRKWKRQTSTTHRWYVFAMIVLLLGLWCAAVM